MPPESENADSPRTCERAALADEPRHRYERKFCLDTQSRHEVESALLLHRAMFREIHHERWVNNIYFDSHDLRAYRAAVSGQAERMKARVRWYGRLFGPVDSATLELKRKYGMVGSKERYSLESFVLDGEFDHDTLTEVFRRSIRSDAVLLQMSVLEPTLLNRYRRRYFQSAEGRLRVTIDSDMEYRPVDRRRNAWSSVYEDPSATVLEIKYDAEDEHRLSELLGHFPFRVTKKSKYVSGILALQ